jgi:hypothetical protein
VSAQIVRFEAARHVLHLPRRPTDRRRRAAHCSPRQHARAVRLRGGPVIRSGDPSRTPMRAPVVPGCGSRVSDQCSKKAI